MPNNMPPNAPPAGMPPNPGNTPPPGGIMGAGKDALTQNMSFFNPADAAMIAQKKIFTADMTVAQALAKVGIDVNGPAQQIVDFAKKQLENGDVVKKMENMSQEDTGEPGQGEGAVPPPTPGPAGIDALMQGR